VSKQSGWISPVVVAGGVVCGTWELDREGVRVAWFREAGMPPQSALKAEVESGSPRYSIAASSQLSASRSVSEIDDAAFSWSSGRSLPICGLGEPSCGLSVIRAPDLDAALEWGRKAARATNLPIEVRPFHYAVED
jgi:hypothetical protein